MTTNVLVTTDQQYMTTAANFVNKYPVITQPGIYRLTVRNVSKPWINNQEREVHIVSFYGLTPTMISQQLAAKIASGESVNCGKDGDVKSTISLQIPVEREIPGTGMEVNVQMSFVTNKSGQQVLAPTSVSIPPAVKPTTSGWDNIIANMTGSENAENDEPVEGDDLKF